MLVVLRLPSPLSGESEIPLLTSRGSINGVLSVGMSVFFMFYGTLIFVDDRLICSFIKEPCLTFKRSLFVGKNRFHCFESIKVNVMKVNKAK
jgi:hypothetical protein